MLLQTYYIHDIIYNLFLYTVNAPHKVNGKELDVKKALPKDGGERGGRGGGGGGGRNDSWGGNAGGKYLLICFYVQFTYL